MIDWFQANLVALLNVIMIDVVLAGDNAIVVGLAASRVAPEIRAKVIFWGIAGAVVLRIVFAAMTAQLLGITGLTLAGGILLLWVCWKMFDHLRAGSHLAGSDTGAVNSATAQVSFAAALWQIIVADVSMSLDNVLAVAGAANGHSPIILIFGLSLSVILMGVAATFIARLLHKHRWIAYVGLAIILFVALHMMYDGAMQVYDCNPSWFGGTVMGEHCPLAHLPAAAH